MAKTYLSLVNSPLMEGGIGGISAEWDRAITGWSTWLRVGGASKATVKLRCDHVRAIVRRTNTDHPRELVLSVLVELCSERNWSNEYRKGIRTSLCSFFDWAVVNGIVVENPAVTLPRVAGDKPRPRPATDEIWEELLEAAAPREVLMARLAGEAGLRRAEVAQCHRDDLVRDRGGWALIVHGKGSKQRVVPITESLATAIIGFCPRGFLFPGQIDGHLSPNWVGQVLSNLMPPGWSAHKLRHRYATRGYAGTRNLRAVQEALGHASVATTERYTMITRDEVRAVSEAAGDGNDAA